MAINKVVYGNQTLIDLTTDTVASSDDILAGKVGHLRDGTVVTGTATGGSGDGYVWQDAQGYVHLSDEQGTQIEVGPLSVTQNGTYTAQTGHAYSPVTVNVSGGETSSKKQIKFIDYDGTILHSYSKSEWQGVSSLPSNPSHTGLTAQGWNWTKAQIDTHLTAKPNDDVWVGQMYITDDGKSRVYIHLEEGRLHPYLGICPNGTVVVDWGDNSPTSTLTGTSLTGVKYADHTYASDGDYTITITVSSGSFAFYGNGITSNILKKNTTNTSNIHRVYTNAVQKVELGTGATIGTYAFCNCSLLSSVTIPSGTTSIGDNAFNNCYSLINITIPSDVTSIETQTFNACYSLINITIPSGVTSIGSNAFNNCYSLSSVTIPSGVTSIGNQAFGGCYSLSSVTIPSVVTRIGNYTFNNCYSLTSITIPNGVTSIGTQAFGGCGALTSVVIPSSVTSISGYVFQNCRSLSSITIPSSVTSIGANVFDGCYSISSITIPSGVTSINDYTFYICSSLSSVTIPSGVTSIGAQVFRGCSSLSNITIPSSVTSIGDNAFYNCYSISSITIPSVVTSIGANVFYGCYSLSSITIPSGVTSIGSKAFYNCYGLSEIHFKPSTPPAVDNIDAFTNLQTECIIYVPTGTLSAYTSATNYPSSATYTYVEE